MAFEFVIYEPDVVPTKLKVTSLLLLVCMYRLIVAETLVGEIVRLNTMVLFQLMLLCYFKSV